MSEQQQQVKTTSGVFLSTPSSVGNWLSTVGKPDIFFQRGCPRGIVKNGEEFEVWQIEPKTSYVRSYETFESAAKAAKGIRTSGVVYEASGRRGCVQFKTLASGRRVGLYHAVQAHLDPEGGPFVTVCEDHNTLVSHPSLAVAKEWLCDPASWCEDCRGEG